MRLKGWLVGVAVVALSMLGGVFAESAHWAAVEQAPTVWTVLAEAEPLTPQGSGAWAAISEQGMTPETYQDCILGCWSAYNDCILSCTSCDFNDPLCNVCKGNCGVEKQICEASC